MVVSREAGFNWAYAQRSIKQAPMLYYRIAEYSAAKIVD